MSKTWPAKDPDAVLDYVYRIPLDAGDSVSGQPAFTRLSGDVTIQTIAAVAAPSTTTEGYGQDLAVWLSGGTAGETSVFRVAWTTVQTRTDDDIITLPVSSHELEALTLTGHAKPLPGHLVLRYPAFAAVPAGTIQYWLTDAERFVGTSWLEGDYAAGLMSLAAHNMVLAGLGTDAESLSGLPAGLTSMKSGSLSLTFSQEAANARLGGGLASTRYGAEYAILLGANCGGPLVAPTGIAPSSYVVPVWP
jgi:hypothetical protein